MSSHVGGDQANEAMDGVLLPHGYYTWYQQHLQYLLAQNWDKEQILLEQLFEVQERPNAMGELGLVVCRVSYLVPFYSYLLCPNHRFS